MATLKDFKKDWTTLCHNSTDCWTESDRFGKTEMTEVMIKAVDKEIAVATSDSRIDTLIEYASTDTPSLVDNIDKLTPIQKFYDRQSIFITGGTGFIGKLLIEKLLRGCPGISCIYVLIRIKKEKNVLQRMEEIVEDLSFVHVSTAYANCLQNPIEERFYDPPMDADKFIDLMDSIDEKLLDDITPQLLGIWPNTYVYTKSIAENVVKKHAGLIPIGIFRPGIVIPTYQEPIQGWINNMYGLVGVTAGGAMGLIRTNHCDGSIKVSVVPGDLTTNALIVSAWDIANNRRSNKEIPIYNYVSKDNPITYEELKDMSAKYMLLVPTMEAIWYYSFRNTKYRPVHIFYTCFLHLLPAFIIDTIALCMVKQPRLLKIYNKIYKTSNILCYFTTTEWDFTNKRWNELTRKLTTEDRELFLCDIKDLVWDSYFQTYFLGIRIYILKDPIETLPRAHIKWRRLYWMHQVLKLIIACVFLIITMAMVYILF